MRAFVVRLWCALLALRVTSDCRAGISSKKIARLTQVTAEAAQASPEEGKQVAGWLEGARGARARLRVTLLVRACRSVRLFALLPPQNRPFNGHKTRILT